MKHQTEDFQKVSDPVRSYLSFKLGEEFFSIPVMKVLEILEVPKITRVPHSPDYLKGVINLRGAVLPVIDTRVKFGMSATNFTINTSILVLTVQHDDDILTVGVLVDSVVEVFEIERLLTFRSTEVVCRLDFFLSLNSDQEKTQSERYNAH